MLNIFNFFSQILVGNIWFVILALIIICSHAHKSSLCMSFYLEKKLEQNLRYIALYGKKERIYLPTIFKDPLTGLVSMIKSGNRD